MELAKVQLGYDHAKDTVTNIALMDASIVPFFNKFKTFRHDSEEQPDEEGKVDLRWHSYFVVDFARWPHHIPIAIQERFNHEPPTLPDRIVALPREPIAPVNTKINVAMPGLGLLVIQEAKVCYDYCTDSLNEELRDGWRILAICPQPDQRRPDYVLGRTKGED